MCANVDSRVGEVGNKVVSVLEKYPVKKAGLFGSVVRNESNKDSDIDILIELLPKADLSLFGFIGIQSELQDVLGRKVDLVQYKDVKPALKEYILPYEVRIYEKDSETSSR